MTRRTYTVQVKTYVTEAQASHVFRVGKGNMSAGIRQLIDEHRGPDKEAEQGAKKRLARFEQWVRGELEAGTECPCCWVDLARYAHLAWCPARYVGLKVGRD